MTGAILSCDFAGIFVLARAHPKRDASESVPISRLTRRERSICANRNRVALVLIATDSRIPAWYIFPCWWAQSVEKTGIDMWQKKCPVCRQPMEKKLPTETVPCTCGKYVWKG